MTRRITASALDRIAACPASHVLPHAYEQTTQATRGTAIHRYLQRLVDLEGDWETALDEVPAEWRADCAAIDLTEIPISEAAAEVAFAYDPRTGRARELGRSMARPEYLAALDPGELGCIVDVVAIGLNRVWIGDYKTGWADTSPRSWQMRLGVLAVARAYGRDLATSQVIRLAGGRPGAESAHWDLWDLEEIEIDLRSVLARVDQAAASPTPDVHPGDHCRYCPAQRGCPARVTLALALAGGQALDGLGAITPEQAGQAWLRLDAIDKIVQQARGDLKSLAAQSPIPIGDGRYLGTVASTRDVIDPDAAYRAIETRWGHSLAEIAAPESRAVTKTGTLATVAKLLRDAGEAKSVAAAQRMLEQQLADAGALVAEPVAKIAEYAVLASGTEKR